MNKSIIMLIEGAFPVSVVLLYMLGMVGYKTAAIGLLGLICLSLAFSNHEQ